MARDGSSAQKRRCLTQLHGNWLIAAKKLHKTVMSLEAALDADAALRDVLWPRHRRAFIAALRLSQFLDGAPRGPGDG
jgi:hypothetical protein